METFNQVITAVYNVVWSPAMLVLLGAAAIWFTIAMKGFQFTGIGKMFRHLSEQGQNTKDTGLSSFQAFATTVGGRVGTGNIAGTATAIFFGGPGALFWMWMAALAGAATGMVECMLGQAYKDRNMGELIGGPAYYMTRGMKHKTVGKVFAILFSIAVLIGPGFLLPAMQTQTAASAVQNALHVPKFVTGIIMVVLVGVVIMGGIKRIGELAEKLAPIMCGVFLVIALIILFKNIGKVPGVFADIFSSAFGQNAVFGGIVGTAFSYGIQRGFFSNDAGNGMSPLISATSDTSHPVKQGLVQGLSVYIDTIIVCSCTGLSVLLAGTYNVAADSTGTTLLVEHVPDLMYGVAFMQAATETVFGKFGAVLLAIILFVFIYTTQLSYSYQLESTCRFLFGPKPGVVRFVRIIFLAFCMFGVLVNGEIIWPMGDIGVGCMIWVNTISIMILSPVLLRIVKDYKKQSRLGLDPIFDPATVGIEDKAGVWNVYVEKKKMRGDYENEALGYCSDAGDAEEGRNH